MRARKRFRAAGAVVALIRTSAANFAADGAATHAAAIAYAALLSIAPLLIVGIGIAGETLKIAYGGHQHRVVEDRLVGLLAQAVGNNAAGGIRTIVDSSFASHRGAVLAQLVGWATFVLAASGLFLTLQTALNAVFHAQPSAGWARTLRDRLLAFGMVLVVGALTIGTALFETMQPAVGNGRPVPGINAAGSFGLSVVVFGLFFKVLPDARIAWRDIGVGAVLTALLFLAGEAAVGYYLRRAGIANGYGAAGSLVVLLVWVYYSAMLLLFGAEITRAIGERRAGLAEGSQRSPNRL
jgi:membrane protein